MAFVPGRNIHENNIISHEIMDYPHKKKEKNRFYSYSSWSYESFW